MGFDGMSLYEDLLEELGGTEYSNYFATNCIFHDDRHPSMMVYEDGFRCLTCRKHGSLKFLAQSIGKGKFHVKVTQSQVLPHWRSWEEKFESVSGIAKRAHRSLELFPEHKLFFKQRKIDQFIEQGMFGYLDGWNLFPIMDRMGKVIDIVVRGTKKNAPRYVLHPDNERESPYLYVPNWHRVLGSDVVYVPFGIVDAWSFEDIELPAITGTAGKSISPDRLKEALEFAHFIFVPDVGEEREAYRLANKLGYRADVRMLKYPEGCKDSDDIRVKCGKDILREMVGV